jgi:aerotaxis receptor
MRIEMTQPQTASPMIDQAITFNSDELFFSITDHRGVILSGNDTFVRISGYSKDELVGKPHSLVRHPDMPRTVFKLLWDTIQGVDSRPPQPVSAYVKNRAKDGRYYWVLASVFPLEKRHLSIRIKPTSPLLRQVISIYSEVCEVEAKDGLAAGRRKLLARLAALGFSSYEEFMTTALREELGHAKPQTADDDSPSHSPSSQATNPPSNQLMSILESALQVDQRFSGIFDLCSLFHKLESDFRSKAVFLTTIAREIGFIASRAQYEKAIVSNQASQVSEQMQSQVVKVNRQAQTILDHTQAAEYRIAISSFQLKMLERFIQQSVSGSTEPAAFTPSEIAENVALLNKAMVSHVSDALTRVQLVAKDLIDLDSEMDKFESILADLRSSTAPQAVNKSKVASDSNFDAPFDSHFDSLLPEMDQALRTLDPEMGELKNIRREIRSSVEIALAAGDTIRPLLDQQIQMVAQLMASIKF